MYPLGVLIWVVAAITAATAQSTQGIVDLAKRRLPNHVGTFTFHLLANQTGPAASVTDAKNDQYMISSTADGKILIEGNSPIALASG
jgi:alpha-N-acetylglucosaminidase